MRIDVAIKALEAKESRGRGIGNVPGVAVNEETVGDSMGAFICLFLDPV